MNQKGFIPLMIIFIILAGLGSGVFLVEKQTHLLSQAFTGKPNQLNQVSSSPSPLENNTQNTDTNFTHKTVFDYINGRLVNNPTPSPIPSQTTKATPKPTSVPTATPKPLATCGINALVDADNSQAVKFFYSMSATGGGNIYASAYQWDFDGNGSWDTDFSSTNGTVAHTYPGFGSYTPKLQIKISNGQVTDICSKTISVPVGISVSFTGTVFKDNNCNDRREPDEPGISGMPLNFDKQDYTFYKTISSNSDGSFNLTVNIPSNDFLTIAPFPDLNKYSNVTDPSVVSYSPFKIHYNVPFATLGSGEKTINKDVPLIPSENLSSCH